MLFLFCEHKSFILLKSFVVSVLFSDSKHKDFILFKLLLGSCFIGRDIVGYIVFEYWLSDDGGDIIFDIECVACGSLDSGEVSLDISGEELRPGIDTDCKEGFVDNVEDSVGNTESGAGNTESGAGNTEGGTGNTGGGTGNTEGGTGNTERGAGNTEGGTGNTGGGAVNPKGGAGNTKGGDWNTEGRTDNPEGGDGNIDSEDDVEFLLALDAITVVKGKNVDLGFSLLDGHKFFHLSSSCE